MPLARFNRPIITCLALSVSMSLAAGLASAASPSRETEKAIEQLRASVDEWRREDAAFRISRKAGTLSTGESEDYAAFVAGLRLRVIEQCIETRTIGGDDAIRGFDCQRPTGPQDAPPKVVSTAHVQTEEEKRASLNARLNELEAEVDESLLKKQQKMKQAATNNSAGSPAAGGGTSAATAGSQSGEGTGSAGKSSGPAGGQEQARAGDTGPSAPPSASGPGKKPQEAAAPKRHQSQDGAGDDDIIARQLREAAEKETDPILKEKLWAEYNKYKKAKQ